MKRIPASFLTRCNPSKDNGRRRQISLADFSDRLIDVAIGRVRVKDLASWTGLFNIDASNKPLFEQIDRLHGVANRVHPAHPKHLYLILALGAEQPLHEGSRLLGPTLRLLVAAEPHVDPPTSLRLTQSRCRLTKQSCVA